MRYVLADQRIRLLKGKRAAVPRRLPVQDVVEGQVLKLGVLAAAV